MMSIWVDDGVMVGPDDEVESVMSYLETKYEIKRLGEVSNFLSMSFKRDPVDGSISISSEKYVRELSVKTNMTDADLNMNVPMSPGLVLDAESPPLDSSDNWYATLVGSLNYLACASRPDISFAVSALARFISRPTQLHMKVAREVF